MLGHVGKPDVGQGRWEYALWLSWPGSARELMVASIAGSHEVALRAIKRLMACWTI